MMTSTVMQKIISPVTFSAKPGEPLPHIEANVIEIRNFKYLMQAMDWRIHPILKGGHLHHFRDLSCVNDRRLHDAEVLGAVCCGSPKTLLEIGTLYGHATEFTYNDTKKILNHCRSGSLILWHDFNPASIKIHDIHSEVCRGINQLYADGLLKNKILHLQDSWVGLYRVS